MKVASFFAGVGGIDIAFKSAGFEVIWANEIDSYACKTYRTNFKSELCEGDIRKINSNDIPDFDVMVGGFPCQAFSRAGKQQGFADTRGTLFFELERILKEKKPKAFFFENVKGLVTHNNGNTFNTILNVLSNLGYHTKYQVCNAKDYTNIPQTRERVYIVGFLDKNAWYKFSFPEPRKNIYINPIKLNVNKKYFYSLESKIRSSFNNWEYNKYYSWRRSYIRETKNSMCPTLTAAMGTGGHNVPIIYTNQGLRKLTPRECFTLMGFANTYKLPAIADCHLYKQAGNSVVVPMVYLIAEQMKKVII